MSVSRKIQRDTEMKVMLITGMLDDSHGKVRCSLRDSGIKAVL